MSFAYPVMLDVTQRQAVIIGGGKVAARKARGLLAAGCKNVRVVATQFCPELPDAVERCTKKYEAKDLQDADLVFAATDSPEVNESIIRDAAKLKIQSCRADFDPQSPGDFSSPAVLRVDGGAVIVAVSALGSPALSAQIRDELINVASSWGSFARLMIGVRPVIRDKVMGPDERKKLFRDLATSEAKTAFENGSGPALWQWLSDKHPFVRGIDELHEAIVKDSHGK